MNEIVFIGGTGRSGTSILRTLLGRQVDGHAMEFESRFTVDPDGIFDTFRTLKSNSHPYLLSRKYDLLEEVLDKCGTRSVLDQLSIQTAKIFGKHTINRYAEWELSKHFKLYNSACSQFLDGIRQYEYFARWPGKSASYLKAPLRALDTPQKFKYLARELIENVYFSSVHKENYTFFYDDNTWNLLYANEISEIFPNAKIIHVVRDPRDVFVSMLEQKWTPSEPSVLLKYLSDLYSAIEQNLKSIEHLTIRLEDLVCHPERHTAILQQYVGCGAINTTVITLSSNSFGKWEKLDKNLKDTLNTTFNYELKKYGYG